MKKAVIIVSSIVGGVLLICAAIAAYLGISEYNDRFYTGE